MASEKDTARQDVKEQVEARQPHFEEAEQGSDGGGDGIGIDPLLDVAVTVAAELGRRRMTVAEVSRLRPGAIVELYRSVADPVELVAQGIPIARGEVVVVDDRFAVRITEILDPRRKTDGDL